MNFVLVRVFLRKLGYFEGFGVIFNLKKKARHTFLFYGEKRRKKTEIDFKGAFCCQVPRTL